MPRSISHAIDEQVERLFENGDATGRLGAAARNALDSISKTESALKLIQNRTTAIKHDVWDGVGAFGLQSKTLRGSGDEVGAKNAIRKKAACLSLVQKLEEIAAKASEIQEGLGTLRSSLPALQTHSGKT
jgi:hypothetical protein